VDCMLTHTRWRFRAGAAEDGGRGNGEGNGSGREEEGEVRGRKGRGQPAPQIFSPRPAPDCRSAGVRHYKPAARFTKYLTTILRLSYDNAKVTIDLRQTSHSQNILRRTQGFSQVHFTCKRVKSSEIVFVH